MFPSAFNGLPLSVPVDLSPDNVSDAVRAKFSGYERVVGSVSVFLAAAFPHAADQARELADSLSAVLQEELSALLQSLQRQAAMFAQYSRVSPELLVKLSDQRNAAQSRLDRVQAGFDKMPAGLAEGPWEILIGPLRDEIDHLDAQISETQRKLENEAAVPIEARCTGCAKVLGHWGPCSAKPA